MGDGHWSLLSHQLILLNRIIRIAAVACTLSLLAGCTARLDPAEERVISFSAGSPLLRDDANTKADYYDNTSFGVFAFKQSGGTWAQLASTKWKPNFMFNQEVVHSTGSNYTYAPIRYWPEATVNTLTFWAYSPYDVNADFLVSGSTSNAYTNNSFGLPDIRFTADGHTDFLYSDVEADQTSATNSGEVQFDFNHALALVDLKAEKIDEDGLYEVTLKGLSFKGIYATGVFKNNTVSPASPDWDWYSYSGFRQDLPIWSGSVVLAHGTATPFAGVMPLPQDLTNDACWLHVEFEVSYHEDPLDPSSTLLSYSTSRNVYLRDVFYSAGSAWTKNSHYTVTIQISPDRPIQFTVSWDDWGADHNYHLSS